LAFIEKSSSALLPTPPHLPQSERTLQYFQEARNPPDIWGLKRKEMYE